MGADLSTLADDIAAGRAEERPVKELGLRGRSGYFLRGDAVGTLVDRKSRFLRKDAERFVAVKQAAEGEVGRALQGVVVIRRAPVCSKARAWLEEQGIAVQAIPG